MGPPLPPSCADCLEIWEPQPAGFLRGCPGIAECFWPIFLHKHLIRDQGAEEGWDLVVRSWVLAFVLLGV